MGSFDFAGICSSSQSFSMPALNSSLVSTRARFNESIRMSLDLQSIFSSGFSVELVVLAFWESAARFAVTALYFSTKINDMCHLFLSSCYLEVVTVIAIFTTNSGTDQPVTNSCSIFDQLDVIRKVQVLQKLEINSHWMDGWIRIRIRTRAYFAQGLFPLRILHVA